MGGTVQSSRSSAVHDYRLAEAWDEGFASDGKPRAAYADLLGALGEIDLGELCEAVTGEMREAGVVFGDGRPFRLDPIPRLIEADEWALLEEGLAQRVRALGAFLTDAYGDRRMVAAGKIPERVIESAECFEPWMLGVSVPLTGCVAGLDLVRDSRGELRVLEDNIRTPSGFAYMAGARAALAGQLPWQPAASPREPSVAFDLLGAALRSSSPDGSGEPSVALVSDGPSNSAWWEHRQIAERLRVAIVTPEDLFVRRGHLYARLDSGGTRELQVVYRRTDQDRLRDADGKATWLVEKLLAPCRNGTLTVVNPLGAGLADDKLVHAYVGDMIRFYLGEEPLVPSVPTYDLGDAEVLEELLPRLGELVIKPRTGHGGAGIVVCPHATDEDRRGAIRRVKAQPGAWIVQELQTLSTHPTVCEGGLEPRHVDLRPFVIGAGEGATVVPGGLTRVAFAPGDLVVNSSHNGGGKDTWILA